MAQTLWLAWAARILVFMESLGPKRRPRVPFGGLCMFASRSKMLSRCKGWTLGLLQALRSKGVLVEWL